MSSIVKVNDNEAVWTALKTSVYPGAKDASIKMVLAYCQAAGLDPLLKPVHLVPMNVKVAGENGGKDVYEWRDVVMPGIGLYRIQASRTGAYAGMADPEFGPDVTETLGEASITYPKFCKVTAKRILDNGTIAEFSATVYWKETYATRGKDTTAPNAMWAKRPYGQLEKCAEALALRKAFPELGAAPTAEEMEGKTIDVEAISEVPAKTVPDMPKRASQMRAEEAKASEATTASAAAPAAPASGNGDKITNARATLLVNSLTKFGKSEKDLKDYLYSQYALSSIADITEEQYPAIKNWVEGRLA